MVTLKRYISLALFASLQALSSFSSLYGIPEKGALLARAQDNPLVIHCIKMGDLGMGNALVGQNNMTDPVLVDETTCVVCAQDYQVGDDITIFDTCGHTAHYGCVNDALLICPGHDIPDQGEQFVINRLDTPAVLKKMAEASGVRSADEVEQFVRLIQNTLRDTIHDIIPKIPRYRLVDDASTETTIALNTTLFTSKARIAGLLGQSLQEFVKNLIFALPYAYILQGSLLKIDFNFAHNINLPQYRSCQALGVAQSMETVNVMTNLDQITYAHSDNPAHAFIAKHAFSHALCNTLYELFMAEATINGSYYTQQASHVWHRTCGLVRGIKAEVLRAGAMVTRAADVIERPFHWASQGASWLQARFGRGEVLEQSQQEPEQLDQLPLQQQENQGALQENNRFIASFFARLSDEEKKQFKLMTFTFLKMFATGFALTHGAPLFPLLAGFYSGREASWSVLVDNFFVAALGHVSGASLLYALGKTAQKIYQPAITNSLWHMCRQAYGRMQAPEVRRQRQPRLNR